MAGITHNLKAPFIQSSKVWRFLQKVLLLRYLEFNNFTINVNIWKLNFANVLCFLLLSWFILEFYKSFTAQGLKWHWGCFLEFCKSLMPLPLIWKFYGTRPKMALGLLSWRHNHGLPIAICASLFPLTTTITITINNKQSQS